LTPKSSNMASWWLENQEIIFRLVVGQSWLVWVEFYIVIHQLSITVSNLQSRCSRSLTRELWQLLLSYSMPKRFRLLATSAAVMFYSMFMIYTQLQLLHYRLEALGQCIPPPRHILPVSRSRSVSGLGFGLPPKFNHLFIGQLPTFPENFMEIHSEVFAQIC